MISADSMKSVLTAPFIFCSSAAATSISSVIRISTCCAWCVLSSCFECRNLWAIFSKPSKQRKEPPAIMSGVMAQGAAQLKASAPGTRIALFLNDPLATAQTIGNSRSGCTPETW